MSAAGTPPSVQGRVVGRAVALLAASLAAVGVVTGLALVVQARAALDEALVAAAHEHAHPEEASSWEVEHSRSPVESWIVTRDDPRVPADTLTRALATEAPTFGDAEGRRLLLLPAETEAHGAPRHVVIAASAPAVRPGRILAPFALGYALLFVGVTGTAGLLLSRTIHAAFAPLRRARSEAEAVLGLGHGARLTEDGPAEVAPLLHAVNGLLDRLDQAWATQARFTADAAHELRTPVTALVGELEVALRRPRGEESYREALESAREEADRLRRLVDALSHFTRLDAGEAGRGREPARASELAEVAVRTEGPAVEAAGGRVHLQVDADAELEVNRPLVELALANLVRNAARHAPGAAVEVRVHAGAGPARFEVDDAGPGVPPEEREAVFARFARGRAARSADPGGLGLGLAFAREVARRHGGDCTIEASPAGGTRAVFTLRGG